MPPPAPEGDPRAPPASSGLDTPGAGGAPPPKGIPPPPPNSNSNADPLLRPRPRGRAPAGKTWDPRAACWVAAGEEPSEPSEDGSPNSSFLPQKFRGPARAEWLAAGRTRADWRRTPLAKRRAFAEAACAQIAIEAGHTGTGDGWDALRGGARRDGAGGALGRGRRRAICAWLLEEDARVRKRRRLTDDSVAQTSWALPLPLALPDARNGSSRRAWDELLRRNGALCRRAELAAGICSSGKSSPAPSPALVHAFALRARRALVQAAQWERSNPASHSPSVRGREIYGQKKSSSSEDARRSLLFAGFRAGAKFPAGSFVGNLRLGHRRVLEQLLQRFLLARDFARVAEVALVLLSSSTGGVDLGDARAGATWQVYALYPAAVCGLEAIFQKAHPGTLSAASKKFLLQARARLHATAKQFHRAAHVGEYGASLSLRAALAQIGHTGEYTVPRRAFAVHQNREMATELHDKHPERAYVALISHRRLLDAVRDVWRDAPVKPPEPPDLLVDLGTSPRQILELGWKRLTRNSLAWGGWFSAASAARPGLGPLFEDAERDLVRALELDLPRGNGVLLRILQLYLLAGRVSAAEHLIGELAQGRRGPLSPAALGAVCAWRSARSGRVDVGSLRQLQAVDPAHPGVLSILLGSAVPPHSAADVRDLVEGLCLVLDGDPLHFEAWRCLALVVSAADPSPKDKVQHFVQTPGLPEPRRVKASRLKSLRVVPEEFRADARRALAGALAPRREWWRRFHLRLDSVFSSSAAMPLDAAGSPLGGYPAAAGSQFSGAWLRCVNYFESEQLRGVSSGSASRRGLGVSPRTTGQPPNVGAYADAWSASAAFPFQPEARTLPARELHLQCFWGKDLGPQGGTGKKPAVLLRTREPRGAARPAAVARPRLQPWMLRLKPQTFEL